MRSLRSDIFLCLGWGVALWGVLQLGALPGQWGHVCGPWGCGPSIKALATWHAFWAVLLALPTLLAIRRLPAKGLRRAGLVSMFAGLAGLVGIAVWEAFHWFPLVSQAEQQHLMARYLFAVATLVDIPIVQLTVVGIVWWVIGVQFLRRCQQDPVETDWTDPCSALTETDIPSTEV